MCSPRERKNLVEKKCKCYTVIMHIKVVDDGMNHHLPIWIGVKKVVLGWLHPHSMKWYHFVFHILVNSERKEIFCWAQFETNAQHLEGNGVTNRMLFEWIIQQVKQLENEMLFFVFYYPCYLARPSVSFTTLIANSKKYIS